MDVRITTDSDGLGEAARARLARLLRSILDPCASRIRLVIACPEDLGVREGEPGWECWIYATLQPAGAKAVVADGEDAETALRGAAGHLARSLQPEGSCCLVSGRPTPTS